MKSALSHRPSALYSAIALLGFATVAGLMHLAAFADSFHLYAEQRSEKLYLLQQGRGKYNAAVFGSSRVHNGLNPHVFDAVLASHSHAIHSINLGIHGSSQTEQHRLALEYIHSLPSDCGPDSCLILFEYNAGLNLQNENLFNPRVINLYTPSVVRFALDFSGRAGTTQQQRIGRGAYALFAGTLNLANLGMLSSAIFRPPLNQKLLSTYTQDDQRGMVSEPPAPSETALVSQVFSAYRHAPSPSATVTPAPPGAYRLVQDTAAASPLPSLRFFYFVTPTLNALTHSETTPCSIKGVNGPIPIFNLARPDRYPELFQSVLWRDPGHLNPKGAAVFSTILAGEVASWLAGANQPGCGDYIAVR